MPYKRSISFPGADYLPPIKTAPGLFVIEMLYRHESPLSLTLRNAPQCFATASNALPILSTAHYLQPPRNQGQGIHEHQTNRGNMLEFNNLGLLAVIELVSKSHKSHKSQRFQGFKFTVQLHC
jgi:hypothetical protein